MEVSPQIIQSKTISVYFSIEALGFWDLLLRNPSYDPSSATASCEPCASCQGQHKRWCLETQRFWPPLITCPLLRLMTRNCFFFVNSFLHIFEPGIAWMCHSQHVTSKAAELSCSFRSIGMFGSVPTVFYWTVNIWSPQQFDLSMSQYNPSVVVFAIAAKLLLTRSWWYHLFYTVLVFSQMLLVCCRTLQNNWLIIGWTLVDKVTTFCVITLNKKKDDTSQD
jgi:hypothetical protein